MSLEELLRVLDARYRDRFFGKYAGEVTDVDDPLKIGRVRARVPAVLGEDTPSGWALPCAPFAGGKDRGFFFLPQVGDSVWIEFAEGDPARPIWTGGWWAAPDSGAETPTSDEGDAGPGRSILKTRAGHRVVIDDDGEVVVIAHGGDKAEIRLTRSGEVVVKAEKIKLGEGAAKAVILGDDFQQLFNMHTHPTGVGPSGPPTQPMQPGHLSTKTFTE